MRRLYRHNGARAARRNWTHPRSRGATSSAAPRFASKASKGKRSRRGVRLSKKSSTRCVVIGVEIKWKCKWKRTRACRVGGIVATRLTEPNAIVSQTLTGAFDPPLDKDIDDVLERLIKAELLLPECPEQHHHLVSPDGTCGDLAGAMRDRCETEGDALAKAIIQGFPIPEEEELETTMVEEPMDEPKKSKEPVTPQLTVSPTVSPRPPPKRKRTKTPTTVSQTRKKSVQVKSKAAAEEEEEKQLEEGTPAPKRKRAPRKPPTPKKCEAAAQPRRESPVVAISKQLQSQGQSRPKKDMTILPSTVRAVRDSMVTQRVDTAIKDRNDAFWDYLEQILSHRDEAIRRDLYAVHAAIALLRKDLQLEQQGVSSEETRETPVTPTGLAEDFAKEAQTRLDQCAKELERLKRHLPSKKPPTKMDAASQKPSDAEEEEEESGKSEEGEPSSEEVEEEEGHDMSTESVDPRLDIHGDSPRGERLSAVQIARRATMRMQTLFAAATAVNAHAHATSPTCDDSPDSVTMKTPRQLHS